MINIQSFSMHQSGLTSISPFIFLGGNRHTIGDLLIAPTLSQHALTLRLVYGVITVSFA